MNAPDTVTLSGMSVGRGVLSAVAANALWASAVVAPLMFASGSPTLLAAGRYVVLGLVCVAIACFVRLPKVGWRGLATAGVLAVTGNVGYYLLLAAAMQLTQGPPAIIILATLPVVVAVVGNLRHRTIAWHRLVFPLAATAFGIAAVNAAEFGKESQADSRELAWGLVLAAAAVAVWTLYAVVNSEYLRSHPHVGAAHWSTLVGVAALPAGLVLIPFALMDEGAGDTDWVRFALVSAFLGVAVSWGGTLLWNHAAARLPDVLAGQLIVVESIIAMVLAVTITGNVPSWLQLVGFAACGAGIVLTLRASSTRSEAPELGHDQLISNGISPLDDRHPEHPDCEGGWNRRDKNRVGPRRHRCEEVEVERNQD